jgi:hypothetical protein
MAIRQIIGVAAKPSSELDGDTIHQKVGQSTELAELAKEWTRPDQPPAKKQDAKRPDEQTRFDRD